MLAGETENHENAVNITVSADVQYDVNAQGHTETWFRSHPHYVMLHVVYRWSKNPKKP